MTNAIDRISNQPFGLFLAASIVLFFSHIDLLTWSTFSGDDTHVSQLALSYHWLEPYYKPEVYQQLSIVHFTPVVLSIYQAILNTFGLDNMAFVIVQLSAMSLIATMSAYLCQQVTQRLSAGFFCLVLIFSNLSILTMLSRFYTVHYLLGAILSLLIVIFVLHARSNNYLHRTVFWLPLCLLVFLALLTKEVYLMLVPLLWVLFYKLRAPKAALVTTLALIMYIALRFYILGISSDGRDGQSFLSGLIALTLDTWLSFIYWYITTKWLICTIAVVAIFRAPQKMLSYLLLAGLFAGPSLAAPHAFQAPQLHGDRLFFMFDIALAIGGILALYSRPISTRIATIIALLALFILVPLQRNSLHAFASTQTDSTAAIINKVLANGLGKTKTLVFTPLNYYQGEYMNIHRLLGNPWLEIVQNCQRALQLSAPLTDNSQRPLLAFDETGKTISREALVNRCQSSQSFATVLTPPTFSKGLLYWSFSVPPGHVGGVLLIDRGIAVGIGEFKQRLVRPKPKERYQLYTRRGNAWWFSDINFISVKN
jgi:hypothetical protein